MKLNFFWIAMLVGGISGPLLAVGPAAGRNRAPSLRVDTAFTASADFEARGSRAGGASVARAGVAVEYPLTPWGKGTLPLFGLRYREHRLELDPGTPLPDRLKSLSVSLAVVHRLDEDWTLIGSVSPGFSEAGAGFSGQGLHVGVFALANRRLSPALTAGIGLAYDTLSRGGQGRVIPVAGFDWVPSDGWRVTLGYPRAGIFRGLTPDLTLEFAAEADFNSYRVQESPQPPADNRPALDRTVLEYKGVLVGPAISWRPSSGFSVRLSAGIAPVLRAEYRKRGYEVEASGSVAYASAEAGWRF